MTEDFAARIGALAGVTVASVREAGTRHGFRHLTATLADGRAVFVKAAIGGGGAAGAFAAEAGPDAHDHCALPRAMTIPLSDADAVPAAQGCRRP